MSRLFESVPGLLHGGDYNPEQWLDRPDILDEDLRLMRRAGVNAVTLGVFAWSVLEPEEDVFRIDWLRALMDRLYAEGIRTILATPTGARPAWLDERYPEAMRVASNGVRNRHGGRHNHCPSSPAFRERAGRIITKLAEALGGHPGLLLWHMNNELGGECWCEHCLNRFTAFLRARYGGEIGRLNREWWTTFWSHRYSRFEQIEPPWPNGERGIHGLNLDWKRFTSWNMQDYLRFERELLKTLSPGIPATTNYMRVYPHLDYHALSREVDIVSWDSYPEWGNARCTDYETALQTAFEHALMRGIKPDRPFLLMESAPGLVNWHPVNKLKRPGIHRLASLQAVACGCDSVLYFQWRKGRGSYEQYHGAVIDHLGKDDTRVFREVTEVGGLLAELAQTAGSTVRARTALLFDWENRWAIDDMAGLSRERHYVETCTTQHALFQECGIEMDVVSPLSDLSGYAVVVAPMLYLLRPGVADALKRYVKEGGHLVATYLTGYVNDNTLCWTGGFPGDGLADLFGLYVEEIDALYPQESACVSFNSTGEDACAARDYCERIRLCSAQALAWYGNQFYSGEPAVARRRFGSGTAWYTAARLEKEGMKKLYRMVWREAGIQETPLPPGVEYHERTEGTRQYRFYLNWTEESREVPVRPGGREQLSGREPSGRLTLPPYQAAVIRYGGES